jgi:hypothetical protein
VNVPSFVHKAVKKADVTVKDYKNSVVNAIGKLQAGYLTFRGGDLTAVDRQRFVQ